MADSNTAILDILLMETGAHENDWGEYTNDNLELIEAAICGTTSKSTTGGTTALTQAECAVPILRITGTLASNATFTWPSTDIQKWMIVENATSGAFSVTVKVSGQTGVVVPQGQSKIVRCNGTDVVDLAVGDSDVSAATTSAAGIVELATDAETQTGTDTARAITPANLTAKEASVANWRAKTSNRILTTDIVWDAAAAVGLSDAATIALDMSTFLNASVSIAGNRTLGNPTNTKVGQSGVLAITASGGTRTINKGSSWKSVSDITWPVSIASGQILYIFYFVYSSSVILVTGAMNNPA